MRQCLFAAVFVFVPGVAAAQAPLDAGMRKLVAGDYQAAAQLLEPLAENPVKPDPAAQFLMAVLYETGRGVARDTMRACGLFLQAAASDSPFAQQAAVLGGRLKSEFGPMAAQLCASGPRHEMPPALFTLGPDHSVQYTSNSIIVRYHGAEQRVGTGMLPGVIPLPIVHTPLDVTRPVQERRHFLQSFLWSPDSPSAPASWTLGWILAEVVGGDYVNITGERNVFAVRGAKPPADFTLSSAARVFVDANGEAAWVIAGGANPRSAVVPRREPRK